MKKRKNVETKEKRPFPKKALLISLFVVLFLGICFCTYFFLLLPQIHLKGGNTITLNYQEKYQEKGYEAHHLQKDLTKKVSVKGKVNSDKLGSYEITYTVKDGSFQRTVTRKVLVKDLKKPKLEIDDSDIYVCPGKEYEPVEVPASDNYDGDLTKKVEVVFGKDKKMVTYQVQDSSHNKKSVSKNIYYEDKEAPVLTLNGNEEMYAFYGETFHDPGATAMDNCDGDITGNIQVSGSVDSSTLGTYTLTYESKDSSGNTASVSRIVTVRERKGIIYLTFDDGPNDGTTNVILDILKEEGVKATFFVTGKGPDELIKREYDEGHTVALHTNTHDYAYLYSSGDAYFEDLYTVFNRVKNITGSESKIIRFPGGSSNTVSRKYCPGIMTYLTQEVLNRGFRYYDWNISSGDAGSTTDPSGVYWNVVNGLRADRANMVLMHDIKSYTRDALRDIIRYGKDNGYIFEKITMDTEMVTQKVAN